MATAAQAEAAITRETRSWSDVLELGSKIVAAVLGAFYVLGILTVNAYVSGFGFTQYSLVESQYLFAGAWAGLFIVISAFPLLAASGVGPKKGEEKSVNRGRGILALFTFAIPFILWYEFLKFLHPPGGKFDAAVTGIIFMTLIFFLTVTGVVLISFVSPTPVPTRPSWMKVASGSIIVGAIFLTVLSAFIWCFAQFIYPRIPNRLGGGKPIRARLLLKHDSVEALRTLGFEAPPDSDQSFPLDIVFQTDKVSCIKTSSGAVLQINNDAVMGSIAKDKDATSDWELAEVRSWELRVDGEWQGIKDKQLLQQISDQEDNIFAKAHLERHIGAPGEDWQCDWRCNGIVSQLQNVELKINSAKASGK